MRNLPRRLGVPGRGYVKPVRPILDMTHPLSHGLRGCYLLGDTSASTVQTLIDIGPSNFNGDTAGLTAPPYASSHHGGMALAFNGTGNGSLGSTSDFGADGGSPRTWLLWVNQTTITSIKGLLTPNGTNSTFRLCGMFCGVIANGDIYMNFSGRDWYTGAVLSNGTWAQIAFTYNGGAVETAGNVKIYFNAASQSLTSTGASTGTLNTYANSIIGLGYDSNNAARIFTGAIEGVRFYSRELSGQEIAWLYNEPYAGVLNYSTTYSYGVATASAIVNRRTLGIRVGSRMAA